MKKSVAVLGLGQYGKSLAENLYRMGADVLVADQNEDLINEFADKCTSAVCANLTEESEVVSLGLKNMDIVVTAMGNNLAATIMSVTVAKEQGVPLVIAKTSSRRMSSILKKVGADKILNPEGEGGERSAKILFSNYFKDYFRVDNNLYMIEMTPHEDWIGKNLAELEIRKKEKIIVVAVKEKGQWQMVETKRPFQADDTLLIMAGNQRMETVLQR